MLDYRIKNAPAGVSTELAVGLPWRTRMTRSIISALAGWRGHHSRPVVHGLMVAASLLTLTGCSATSTDNDDASQKRRGGIVNGEETNDFPGTGMMLMQGQAICTGTVVAPRSVLTAAHCVDNMDASQLE